MLMLANGSTAFMSTSRNCPEAWGAPVIQAVVVLASTALPGVPPQVGQAVAVHPVRPTAVRAAEVLSIGVVVAFGEPVCVLERQAASVATQATRASRVFDERLTGSPT
jgi:hypothetical protein